MRQTLTSSKTYVFRLNIAIFVFFMPYLNDLWFTYVTYIGHLWNLWFTYGLLQSIGIVEGLAYLGSFSFTINLHRVIMSKNLLPSHKRYLNVFEASISMFRNELQLSYISYTSALLWKPRATQKLQFKFRVGASWRPGEKSLL